MKKITIFLACLLGTLGLTAQTLYIYKTDGTVYGRQTATIDSINFSKAQDSMYVHHKDTINRYAVSEVDSLSFTAPSSTSDRGVLINGVKWATRNVGTPGTFVTSSEVYGDFYQWNSNIGWPSTGAIGSITATDGSKTWNSNWKGGYTNPSSSDTWKSANDPSPTGWRIPTYAEIQTLLDGTKVTATWTIQNSVYGEKFTDKTTGATLFLPASGCRGLNDGALYYTGEAGLYWSSTAGTSVYSYNMDFTSSHAYWIGSNRAYGYAVRSVSK